MKARCRDRIAYISCDGDPQGAGALHLPRFVLTLFPFIFEVLCFRDGMGLGIGVFAVVFFFELTTFL